MSAGVIFDGNLVVYRASALGGCIKALAAARQGYSPMPEPPRMEQIFQAGNEAEDRTVTKLREAAWLLWGQQRVITLPVTKLSSGHEVVVRGHIDGFIAPQGEGPRALADIEESIEYARKLLREEGSYSLGEYMSKGDYSVCEIKSQGARTWEEFALSGFEGGLFAEKYRWQASVYYHGTNRPVRFVRVNRETDEVVVHDDMPEDWYYTLEDILARVQEVEVYAAMGTLPEECNPAMFPCSYLYLHEPEAESPLSGDEAAELELLSIEYGELYRIAADAKARMDEIRTQAQGSLSLLGVKKVHLPNGARVTLVDRTTRTLDKKAVKAAGIDLTDYYTETASQYALITPRKEPDGTTPDTDA